MAKFRWAQLCGAFILLHQFQIVILGTAFDQDQYCCIFEDLFGKWSLLIEKRDFFYTRSYSHKICTVYTWTDFYKKNWTFLLVFNPIWISRLLGYLYSVSLAFENWGSHKNRTLKRNYQRWILFSMSKITLLKSYILWILINYHFGPRTHIFHL